MTVDIEQLCGEVQEFLDHDPRFFDQDEGAFPYYGATVYFEKSDDWFILTVDGVEITCSRP